MSQEHCTVIIHGLSAADAHMIVRLVHEHAGDYWARRVIVSPSATDWVVESHTKGSDNWRVAYGPWSEHNAFQFVNYWNKRCGWDLYRATPVMTESRPVRRSQQHRGGPTHELFR
jgi:hypothetical protein